MSIVIDTNLRDDDINFIDSDEDFIEQRSQFLDPYEMNRHLVGLRHFRDARVYDQDLGESGWFVQRHTAKMAYRQWIESVRSEEGWEQFHKPSYERTDKEQDKHGNTYLVTRMIYPKVPGRNIKDIVLSCRKQVDKVKKNVSPPVVIDVADEDYEGRLFTVKMGKRIQELRSDLNLTQRDLAFKLNVDLGTVRNMEQGNRIPFDPQDKLVKNLIKVLEITSFRYIK